MMMNLPTYPAFETADTLAFREDVAKHGIANKTALLSLIPSEWPNEEFAQPESFEQPFLDKRYEPTPIASPTPTDDSKSLGKLIGLALESIDDNEHHRYSQEWSSDEDSMSWCQPVPVESGTKRGIDNQNCSSRINKRPRIEQQWNHNETNSRFRPHHDNHWHQQLNKLLEYKEQHGNCCVPITFEGNRILARWVKRQRYQYKQYQEGKTSTMNARRIHLLESIGFVWDTHSAQWQRKFNELAAYTRTYGHCRIASFDPKHAQLSTWAKCQRRQYILLKSGKSSNITQERIEQLNSLGFLWNLQRK